MTCEALREQVCAANLELVRRGLVVYTWGNVSGIDRAAGVVAIKPSGIEYDELAPEHVVLLRLSDGAPLEPGGLRPSSDTPTHLALYRAFPGLGGIAHTHSLYATTFAQACRPLPCIGTTHADHFNGAVPLTRALTPAEIAGAYEVHTGAVIIETFRGLDPLDLPAVLVAHHGPFTWGASPAAAVRNSVVLETVAHMALGAFQLNPTLAPVPEALLRKHFRRKHGPDAYYGQAESAARQA
jgi:L-ribulose-5-phosphate 4-epimerase